MGQPSPRPRARTPRAVRRPVGHGASLLPVSVVPPTKSNLTVCHGNQAGVSNGDAMSIAREIGQHLRGPAKGRLAYTTQLRGAAARSKATKAAGDWRGLSSPARVSLCS